jgi:hypothetical protein
MGSEDGSILRALRGLADEKEGLVHPLERSVAFHPTTWEAWVACTPAAEFILKKFGGDASIDRSELVRLSVAASSTGRR